MVFTEHMCRADFVNGLSCFYFIKLAFQDIVSYVNLMFARNAHVLGLLLFMNMNFLKNILKDGYVVTVITSHLTINILIIVPHVDMIYVNNA